MEAGDEDRVEDADWPPRGAADGELDLDWIEYRALAVLQAVPAEIWDGEKLPVPVEEIVDEHFGLFIREMDDLTRAPGCPKIEPGQSLSALLIADQREIWVSAEEARQWPPRRRFSIAHELGHWHLHQDGQQSLFCRRAAVDEGEEQQGEHRPKRAKKRPDLPLTEREANAFASALLMPGYLVRRHYERTEGSFHTLCDLFASSMSAMGRRLHTAVPRQS